MRDGVGNGATKGERSARTERESLRTACGAGSPQQTILDEPPEHIPTQDGTCSGTPLPGREGCAAAAYAHRAAPVRLTACDSGTLAPGISLASWVG
jgi:hypothetical protein